MTLVLDASVLLKWFARDNPMEEHVEGAMAIFDRVRRADVEVLQPPHWCAEVMSVLARKHPGHINAAVQLLDLLDFPMASDWRVYQCAAGLAVQYEHHLLDTLYHAVALEHGAELITADRRYYHKAMGLGAISLLGQVD